MRPLRMALHPDLLDKHLLLLSYSLCTILNPEEVEEEFMDGKSGRDVRTRRDDTF